MEHNNIIRFLPYFLVGSRFLVAIFLLWDSRKRRISFWFLAFFTFAVFSDWLDTFLCRIFAISPPLPTLLSMLDGYADASVYISALLSAMFVYPDVIKKHRKLILLIIVFQMISWTFSIIKFGKITSYHTYLAKPWAITIFLAFLEIFLLKKSRLISIMAIFGVLCISEDIIITHTMPYWRAGIVTKSTAIKLSNEYNQVHRVAK